MVDAVREGQGHVGSTPTTSTIFNENGALRNSTSEAWAFSFALPGYAWHAHARVTSQQSPHARQSCSPDFTAPTSRQETDRRQGDARGTHAETRREAMGAAWAGASLERCAGRILKVAPLRLTLDGVRTVDGRVSCSRIACPATSRTTGLERLSRSRGSLPRIGSPSDWLGKSAK